MGRRALGPDAVELDGPATRRLVRALSAGVPMDALERRFGRNGETPGAIVARLGHLRTAARQKERGVR